MRHARAVNADALKAKIALTVLPPGKDDQMIPRHNLRDRFLSGPKHLGSTLHTECMVRRRIASEKMRKAEMVCANVSGLGWSSDLLA